MLFRYCTTAILALFALFACQKKEPHFGSVEDKPSAPTERAEMLEEIEQLFKESYQESALRSTSADTTFYFEGLKPLWDKASQRISSDNIIFEIPIQADRVILPVSPTFDAGEDVETAIMNYTTLIAIAETEQNSLRTTSLVSADSMERVNSISFMSLLPSKKYIDSHKSLHHTANRIPFDFDGLVEYRSLRGELIVAYAYEDGELTKRLLPENTVETRDDKGAFVKECFPRYVKRKTYFYATGHRDGGLGQDLDGEHLGTVFIISISEETWEYVGEDCFYYWVSHPGHPGFGGGGDGGGSVSPPPEKDPKGEEEEEEEGKPCADLENGKANPLKDMKLRPTKSGSYSAGRFGKTRNGNTKIHDGIDLEAPVGTPIYAMFDGTISAPFVSDQPNKIYTPGKGISYPADYKGDRQAAGNRFYINSEVDGANVTVGYWHLNANGKGIAENPRTGEPFKPGDKVNAGEVVGYTGETGNALGAGEPHLHLCMRENGKKINPEKYLNATVSNKSKITTPCD